MSFVLGSGSPRRRELLEPLVGPGRLSVRAPTGDEEGFEGLQEPDAIRHRLHRIVRTKMENVLQQLADEIPSAAEPICCVAADTIVVAGEATSSRVVLGKPNPERWEQDVRDWMLQLYSGTTHEVWTGFQIVHNGDVHEQIVTTRVGFCSLTPELVDWYLSTGESVGKAGGYAIQGAAAAFVTSVEGSLTNIIGLPVLEVVQALDRLGIRHLSTVTE